MIITKKALPRRTFLRGMGATLALPLLDAMVPSLTALANTPADPACAGSGSSSCRWAATSSRWTPPGTTARSTSFRRRCSPLEPVKRARHRRSPIWSCRTPIPGTHATSNSAFLSAAKAKQTESTDYYLGTTVDQIAAQQIGSETQLPSLELSMDLLADRRPVRQRLRLRLSEQPFLVVADDAAAGRRRIRASCSSACSAKAAPPPNAARR